jgi:predicted RNA binding protein YcfA (HicA-like mRNA interferase family)
VRRIYAHRESGSVKIRDVVKALRKDGWIEQPRKPTAHRQFKHPAKPR